MGSLLARMESLKGQFQQAQELVQEMLDTPAAELPEGAQQELLEKRDAAVHLRRQLLEVERTASAMEECPVEGTKPAEVAPQVLQSCYDIVRFI